MICGIKPKTLSDARLSVLTETLVNHNLVLETLSKQFPKLSMKKFRQEFLAGRIKPKINPTQRKTLSLLTEEIKLDIVAHHIKSVKSIALSYCFKFGIHDEEGVEDVLEQALIACLETLYSFNKTKTKFVTYLYSVVRNELNDYFRTNFNGMSPLPKEGLNLNSEIYEYRAKQVTPISYDQAAKELGYTEEQYRKACEANRRVLSMSNHDNEEDVICSLLVCNDNPIPDPDLVDAFHNCPLDPVERAVMDNALNPWHGWITETGKSFPVEGKPRSKQNILKVLERSRKKVQNYYNQSVSMRMRKAS